MNFEQAVSRIADLKGQIAAQEEEIADLFASFPQFSRIDRYPAGDYIVRVEDNRRFDAATATVSLPRTKLKAISVSKPDAALARKMLSGADYALCQKSFGVKRTIVEVTDDEG